jgi:hypothetical protein
VAAVTVGVAEARFFAHVRGAAGVARRGADEVVAADQLAVAAALVDAARGAGAEVVAGAQRIDVDVAVDRIGGGERRGAEVDARVDHADDHALALHAGRAARFAGGAGPDDGRADQGRADVGVHRVFAIGLDQAHAAHGADARGFGDGHVGDDAVDRVLHAAAYLQRPLDQAGHLALHLLLLALQVAHVFLRGLALDVQTRTAEHADLGLRHRDAGHFAAVRGQRGVGEQHQVGAAVVALRRLGGVRRGADVAAAGVEPLDHRVA